MADRIAVMREGRIAQVGRPHELYHRPDSRFVADFLGETNFVAAEVVGREGELAVLETTAGRFYSRTYPHDLPTTGNVTCSIRPEALKLHANGHAGSEARNTFAAAHDEVVYLGEIAQHHLQVGEQLHLTAFELNPDLSHGSTGELRVHVAPEDVVILRD